MVVILLQNVSVSSQHVVHLHSFMSYFKLEEVHNLFLKSANIHQHLKF